jgi:hypothetical protein
MAKGDKDKFLELFDEHIKEPLENNPDWIFDPPSIEAFDMMAPLD